MTGAGFRHRLQFGAESLDASRTRFRLWAPAAGQAPPVLVLDDGRELAMADHGAGWFELVAPAPPGTRYRYRVAGGQLVPDPASRRQSGDVHGWSVVVDPHGYRWRHPGWKGRPWSEAVLYELHVGAFAGDFAGVARRLPYLRDLGVTAIELMPVADFPGARNWGYDGVLPFAPDEAYGGPDELKRLIDEAHGLGLMMFLDVVYNHFGPDGNFLHLYAPQFFARDHATPWGAAIDFSRREVRDFFIENALFWLDEYRFDGLRLDAAHAIDAAPGDGVLEELAQRVNAMAGGGRQLHLVLEHDDNAAKHLAAHLYDAQWNDDAHHALHVLLTGERDGYYRDYAAAPATQLARCLAEGFAFQGEPSTHREGQPRGEPSRHLQPLSFVAFVQNHDQIGNRALGDRLAGKVAAPALRVASALMLLAPQIPLLFMGEEWESRRPFQFFTAHTGELAIAVRDGRRREFARFAAFAEPGMQEAIPDPNDPASFARSCIDWTEPGSGDHAEALALRRHLLALRHRHVVPHLDGAAALGAEAIGDAALRAAWRLGDGTMLEVFCNLGAAEIRVAPRAPATPLFALPDDVPAALARGILPGFAIAWHLDAGAAAR